MGSREKNFCERDWLKKKMPMIVQIRKYSGYLRRSRLSALSIGRVAYPKIAFTLKVRIADAHSTPRIKQQLGAAASLQR